MKIDVTLEVAGIDRMYLNAYVPILQTESGVVESFFEEMIRENLDIGRPSHVQLIFNRRVTKKLPGRFCTRVITEGVTQSLHIDDQGCQANQYHKDESALRTEWTIKSPGDFGIGTAKADGAATASWQAQTKTPTLRQALGV